MQCKFRAVKWNEQLNSIWLELNSLIVVNKSSSSLRYTRLINKASKLDSFVIRAAQLDSIRKGIYVILQFKNIKIENYRLLLESIYTSSSCKLDSFVIIESSSSHMSHLMSRVRIHFKARPPSRESSTWARVKLESSSAAKYSTRFGSINSTMQ